MQTDSKYRTHLPHLSPQGEGSVEGARRWGQGCRVGRGRQEAEVPDTVRGGPEAWNPGTQPPARPLRPLRHQAPGSSAQGPARPF